MRGLLHLQGIIPSDLLDLWIYIRRGPLESTKELAYFNALSLTWASKPILSQEVIM